MAVIMCGFSDRMRNIQNPKEGFSPLGFTQNCPSAKSVSPAFVYPDRKTPKSVKIKGLGYIQTQSPGSAYQSKKKVKFNPETNVRVYDKALPLGAYSTMVLFDKGSCIDNVNGINKSSGKNVYGEMYPGGNQSYSMAR